MDNVGNDRVTHLDGLRGFCALIVVLHHFVAAFYPAVIFGNLAPQHIPFEWLFYSTPFNIMIGGNFAVTIFFVLSGYVLSFAFFKNSNFKQLQSLAIRRYPRLMIPVFVSVLFAFFLLRFFNFSHLIVTETYSFLWLGAMFSVDPFFKDALYQGIIGAFIDSSQWTYNHVIWSMYYEFLGSFLVFGFLALFGNIKRRYLVYGFLTFVFFKSYFLGFILGVLTADIFTYLDNKQRFQIPSFYWWGVLVLGALLGSYPLFSISHTLYQYFHLSIFTESEQVIFYHTLGAFLVVNSVLYLKTLRSFFSFKIFRFLGKISFSLYLLHTLVIFSFSTLLFYICFMFFDYHLSVLLTFIISIILIILLAHLYYQLVDKPSMQLSRKFSKKIINN